MQQYIEAKFRITQNQTPEDSFVYWNEDPVIKKELSKHGIQAHLFPFSEKKQDGAIGYTENNKIIITEPIAFNMEQEKLALTGKHNLYNSLAAGISANISGITNEKIRKALSDFKGVEHRLEYVASVRGVDYINDSKATNVNSCWYALNSIKTKIVLILGGTDKGNDYNEISELIEEKCSGLIFLGKDNSKLQRFFKAYNVPQKEAKSMQEAVNIAYTIGKKGETVLLSPACASFDLFTSYEDRGDQFKNAVLNL